MRSDFEERKQDRIERYEQRAKDAKRNSDELNNQASRMASVIPMGQPILIGHHSERRDRNYRDKIHNKFRKSYEEQKRSEYWAGRAASAESNTAISSDDPTALEKLQQQLADLEAFQQKMKSINKAFRQGKLAELGMGEEEIAEIQARVDKAYSWEKQPYPGYMLSNNNANIRRVRQRIEDLKRLEATPTTTETINDVEIINNTEENRVQIFFPGKPEEEVRKELKQHGFRWSPRQGCWQRQCSSGALYHAREIVQGISPDRTTT